LTASVSNIGFKIKIRLNVKKIEYIQYIYFNQDTSMKSMRADVARFVETCLLGSNNGVVYLVKYPLFARDL